jgi:hypothetical protein
METTSDRRDMLYKAAFSASVAFVIILATIMTVYKLNEDYFSDNSRFRMLMDSISTKEENVSYPKMNIKVDFVDSNEKCLVIPLETYIGSENVSVKEEFTNNKYVITLSGYGEFITGDITLNGDLNMMGAAGAYLQNGNVVVEVYCNDNYGYYVKVSDTAVTVDFYNVDEKYDYKAVVWVPYSDNNKLGIPMFKDELEEYAGDRGIKLYLSSDLENEYSQNDIIEFANNIKADMVIGIETKRSTDAKSYMAVICNTLFFMPDYDSARLALDLLDGFANAFDYEIGDFIEADFDDPLVYEAKVPAAVIRLSVMDDVTRTDEGMYKLYEGVYYGVENTIDNVIAKWRLYEDE